MSKLYRDFTTRAQIDAEYDVERSGPDFMVHARQYVDGSAAARNHFTAITEFADPQSALCREVFRIMRHTPVRPAAARRPRLPSRRRHGEAARPEARAALRPRIPPRRPGAGT